MYLPSDSKLLDPADPRVQGSARLVASFTVESEQLAGGGAYYCYTGVVLNYSSQNGEDLSRNPRYSLKHNMWTGLIAI